MRDKMLPYGHHKIEEDDIKAVCDVLRSDWITQGSKIDEFELKLAAYCGRKYAVAVSSGTAALHLACEVAGIRKSDEVITTPLTFVATSSSIVHCGAKPVFCDIQEDTLNIDPNKLEDKFTSRTKAIIPVDFAGHPCDLEEILTFAYAKGLIVIQDSCHALGAEYYREGKADMVALSFHPVKHITTGEGGAILTDNTALYNWLKMLRHHGIVKIGSWQYEIENLGYNYRITDFQCALGISQLMKMSFFFNARRAIADKYNSAFKRIGLITPIERDYVRHAYHIYVIQLQEALVPKRDEIIEELRRRNIGATVHYTPLHLQPYFQREFGYKAGEFPITERYYKRAITLPLFPAMTDEDVKYVIENVKDVVEKYE